MSPWASTGHRTSVSPRPPRFNFNLVFSTTCRSPHLLDYLSTRRLIFSTTCQPSRLLDYLSHVFLFLLPSVYPLVLLFFSLTPSFCHPYLFPSSSSSLYVTLSLSFHYIIRQYSDRLPVIASSFKLQFRHHHFSSSSSPFLFRYTVTSLPPFSICQSLPPFSFSPSCSWYSAQSLDLSSIPSAPSTQLLSTCLSQFSSLDLSTSPSLIHRQPFLQIVIYPLSNSRPPLLRQPLSAQRSLPKEEPLFQSRSPFPTRDVRRSGRTTHSRSTRPTWIGTSFVIFHTHLLSLPLVLAFPFLLLDARTQTCILFVLPLHHSLLEEERYASFLSLFVFVCLRCLRLYTSATGARVRMSFGIHSYTRIAMASRRSVDACGSHDAM
jgi:hypothetical protein